MTEKQATESLIKYCEAREKEIPEIKHGYYSRIKKGLQRQKTKILLAYKLKTPLTP